MKDPGSRSTHCLFPPTLHCRTRKNNWQVKKWSLHLWWLLKHPPCKCRHVVKHTETHSRFLHISLWKGRRIVEIKRSLSPYHIIYSLTDVDVVSSQTLTVCLSLIKIPGLSIAPSVRRGRGGLQLQSAHSNGMCMRACVCVDEKE